MNELALNKAIKRFETSKTFSHDDNLPGILQRVYSHRKVGDVKETNYEINNLLGYESLMGIDNAVSIIASVIQSAGKITIVGDFDVDGATSTTLAMLALKAMGAAEVRFIVPNRFEYGYGLTPEIVDVVNDRDKPDLIITVDNGISSIEGVQRAKQESIQVIITDHHLPGSELPAADAIVNPNQTGDHFPSKMLAGVGVIFYVMLALRSDLRESNWFEAQGITEPNMADYLDLVALGTVADVVPLDFNNRILVAQGLARIRAGKVRPGIKALINVAGREPEHLVASDFGFAIAPRLNAAGRLDDMSVGIHCLLSDNDSQATTLAAQLNEINLVRRDIESGMKQQAEQALKLMHLDENSADSLPYGICLFEEDFHEGVVGIIASRIKDAWHRPVIVFAATENNTLKGSCRSVKGFHIRDGLDHIATCHPGLIKKFGGHAMAAGLTLARDDLETFTTLFDQEVQRHLDKDDLHGVVHSDGELLETEFTMEIAETLRYAGPWGQGFPEPIFDGVFTVVNKRIVGEKHLKLLLQPKGSKIQVDAIAFNTTDENWPENTQTIEIAYRLDVNVFRGMKSVQLMIDHLIPV